MAPKGGVAMSVPFQLAACAEMLWPERPLAWRCARLAEMGFHVGLWNYPGLDLAALERSGATFGIMNGFLRGGLGTPEAAEAMLESAKDAVAVGKRLGVARLNLLGTALGDKGQAGAMAPVGEVTGAMWVQAADTLRRVVDLAEAEDVVFVLENLNVLVDHPGVPFASAEDTRTLVSAIDHPRLKLNRDLYHVQIGAGNLIETCRRCLPWIGEIQVADVPGRREPGTGEVNWAGVARALHGMGYAGTVTLESHASGSAEDALAAFAAAFTL
jgi:hydroxypyruvate isomerase